jgi:hypothetical protein
MTFKVQLSTVLTHNHGNFAHIEDPMIQVQVVNGLFGHIHDHIVSCRKDGGNLGMRFWRGEIMLRTYGKQGNYALN